MQKSDGLPAARLLFIFFGMTASGKSHLSTAWASRCRCARFNTDVVRKGLVVGKDSNHGGEVGLGQGLYSPEFSRRTYDLMQQLAEEALADPLVECIVLDGSYQRRAERDLLMRRFNERVQLLFVYCFCSEEVTRERLALRLHDPDAVSDGNLKVYLSQRETFERPVEIPSGQLLELDTDAQLEYLIGRLEHFLRCLPVRRLPENS